MKTKRRITGFIVVFMLLANATLSFAAGSVAETAGPVYVIDNDGFPMTCRALTARLTANGNSYTQIEREGAAASPDEYVGSGMEICFLDEFGTLLQRQTIVVVGDVTGSGEASMAQVVRIARNLTGEEALEGPYLLAADLDGSASVNVYDLVLAARQAAAVAAPTDYEIVGENWPFYVSSPEPATELPVAVVNGEREIPYVSLAVAADAFLPVYENDYQLEDLGEGIIMIYGPDNTWVELNCAKDTVVFENYDAFFRRPYQSTSLDMGTNASYLDRPAGSFERRGLPISADLYTYNIDLIYSDGNCFIPLTTFSDLFMARALTPLLTNGEGVFMTVSGGLGGAKEAFYAVPTGDRSESLAEFTYNELCLTLDMYYGLKEQHDIVQFNTLFEQTGLKERMLSPDPEDSSSAMADLVWGVLGDIHSSYASNSYLLGADVPPAVTMLSPSVMESDNAELLFRETRAKYFPDGPIPYQEVEDTAYVTFDAFVADPLRDYSQIEPNPVSGDTIELIMYAHQQIMREDSPIDNVVIDLSANTGGDVNAAIAVVAWYLGSATLNINSSMTEAQASTRYQFDVNQDGVFDADDALSSKRLFCMTSPVSFSSGNLVPACFKASDEVVLIGQDTAGGACSVWYTGAADGTVLRISSPMRISTLTNGSFYDVDQGVEVEIPIRQVDHFYDRETLTAFVNGIFR